MEEIIDKLKRLGLTEYQSKALAALLKGGEMPATQIATAAGVPITKLYSILEALSDMGLIVVSLSRPKLYRVIDVKLMINQLVKRQEAVLQVLQQEKEGLIRELTGKQKQSKSQPARVQYFGSSEAMWNEMCKMALRAKHTLRACADTIAWSECIAIGTPLKAWHTAVVKKHVESYNLSPAETGAAIESEKEYGTKALKLGLDIVRYYLTGRVHDRSIDPKLLLHSFIVRDEEEVAFALKNENNETCSGILIVDRQLAQGMAQYFDQLFKLGKPFNQLEIVKSLVKIFKH